MLAASCHLPAVLKRRCPARLTFRSSPLHSASCLAYSPFNLLYAASCLLRAASCSYIVIHGGLSRLGLGAHATPDPPAPHPPSPLRRLFSRGLNGGGFGGRFLASLPIHRRTEDFGFGGPFLTSPPSPPVPISAISARFPTPRRARAGDPPLRRSPESCGKTESQAPIFRGGRPG